MLLGAPWKPTKIGVQTHNVDEYSGIPDFSEVQFFTHRSVTAVGMPEELFIRKAASVRVKTKSDKQPPVPENFLDLFKLIIKPYLSMGKLPIKLAAEILDMHVRKIQRRLDAYGVTYSEVVEQLVLEQALHMLTNTTEAITKIANQMGYSDAAHFNRAFKRMMNQTPGAYRKAVKSLGES
ncbi:transcriptional regulator [Vibrio sp. JCM 19236]|nr:transcriptional regulator [Vibrio sp. JCM 19236]